MAGAGWRDFVAGEVLTAANVQDYLQDQAVMTFASSAARGSAIASPTEGMVSYLKDTDRLEVYTTAWTSYTAGLIPITTVSFTSAATVNFNSVFSSKYDNYRIVFNAIGSTTLSVFFRLRSGTTDNTAAEWDTQELTINGASATPVRVSGLTNALINVAYTDGTSSINDVFSPYLAAYTRVINTMLDSSSATAPIARLYNSQNGLNTSFDGFTLYTSTGTMTGTATVYGYAKV